MGTSRAHRRPPRPLGVPRTDEETGGIVTSWLLQILVIVAVIGFVGYEGIAAAVNTVQIEDEAQEVARAAARAFRDSQQLPAAEEAARAQAQAEGIDLLDVVVDGDFVEATVRDTADTLVIHRISALDSLVTRTATSRVSWRPS